jgi:hypothetical protein
MPVTFYYDKTDKVLYDCGKGVVTGDDVLRLLDELSRCEMAQSIRVLSDYTSCELQFDCEDIKRIELAIIDGFYADRDVRHAICAANALGFGLARSFATMAGDTRHDIQVFRSLQGGREWLGLPFELPESREE